MAKRLPLEKKRNSTNLEDKKLPRMKTHNWTRLLLVGFSSLLCVSLLASISITSADLLPGSIPVWENMNPTTNPGIRINSPLSYDSTADRVIVFGGWRAGPNDLNDTWTYDYNTNTWTNRTPSTAPPIRAGHGLAYDSESDRTILFSGWQSGSGGTLVHWVDTWTYEYSSNTWTNMSPVVTPPGKLTPSMAYDSESDRVILFGGLDDGGTYSGETWAYDFNTNNWTLMNPSTNPSDRFDAPMTYDSESDRIIMIGGWNAGGFIDDVWAYDFNTDTWTLVDPGIDQSAIGALTYDSATDRVIAFGGSEDFGETLLSQETWLHDFNTNTWTQMLPASSPPARARPYLVYDSESNVTILYGGKDVGDFDTGFEDTWAYYYEIIIDGWCDPLICIGIPAVVIVVVVIVVVVWYRRRE
jgi:N-acetylneuraminic acid mutarotase